MNVQILYDGVDITSEVVSYDREQAICTGVGQLRIETTRNFSVDLYKEISIYEESTKKGTYFIHTIDEDLPKNVRILNCQDGSLKLQNYFIAETYLIDYPSNSDYWISKFLEEATISYVYDGTETGTLLNNNTALGKMSAMDAIVPLLQQNGWYMYFDADNTCHIGVLEAGSTGNPSATLTGSTILNLSIVRNDKRFRNRIVVWGGTTKQGDWIFSDLDNSGNYVNEYDSNDKRSVVIANSNIDSSYTANLIAGRALKEFDKISNEISVSVAGNLNVTLGSYVTIKTSRYSGGGMVTTIGSSLSETGFITNLVLNQKCPRLFAYYKYGADSYVYVGTQGNGVWRKPLETSDNWTDFSTGISTEDKNITDLAINNDVFACVSDVGNLYTNFWGGWVKFDPGSVTGVTVSGTEVTFPASSGVFTCCAIDKATNEIIAGYSINGDEQAFSWIYFIEGFTTYSGVQVTDDDGFNGYTIVGLDNNGIDNIVSVTASSTAIDYLWNNSNYYLSNNENPNTTAFLDAGYYSDNRDNIIAVESSYPQSTSVCSDGKYIFRSEHFWGGGDGWLGISVYSTVDPADIFWSGTYYFLDLGYTEASWVRAIGNGEIAFLYQKDDTSYIRVVNFILGTSRDIPTSIPYELNVIGVNVSLVNGRQRYYVACCSSASPSIYLYYYDFLNDRTQYACGGGVDSSFYGGTFADMYGGQANIDNLAVLENDIFLTGTVVYYDVTINDYLYTGVSVPFVAHCSFSNWSHSSLTASLGPAYHLAGLGDIGAVASYSNNVTGCVATKDTFYIKYYANYDVGEDNFSQECVYKYRSSINNGVTAMFTWTGNDSKLIGNKDNAYYVSKDGSTLTVYNANSGAIVDTIVSTDSTVSAEVDEVLPGILVYSRNTGDVRKYPIASSGIPLSGVVTSGNLYYSLDLYPDETEGFSGGEDHVYLIHDTIFVTTETRNFPTRRIKTGLITPSGILDEAVVSGIYGSGVVISFSGERLIPADFSTVVGNPDSILKGYKGAYSKVLDVSMPYNVEISQPDAVSLWGNISYSGVVVSGSETGYSYGEILLSPTGDENTYSQVIVNSLNGSVPDVRTFTTISPVGDDFLLRKFCLYPQTNELVLLNITDLSSTSDVIISSGTLGEGSILATFEDTIGHLETTNTQDIPYMFVSLPGPQFWQKNAYRAGETVTNFINRTNNLPLYEINVIRADDTI